MSEKKPNNKSVAQANPQAKDPIIQPVTEVTGPGSIIFDVDVNVDNSLLPNAESIAKLQAIGVWNDVLIMAKSRQVHEQTVEMQRLKNNELAIQSQIRIAECDAQINRDNLNERRSSRIHGMIIIGGLVAVGIGLIAFGKGVEGLVSLLSAIGILLGSVLVASRTEKK